MKVAQLPVFPENAQAWMAKGSLRFALAVVLLTVLIQPAFAEDESVTPSRALTLYTGFRDGGNFQDIATERSLSLNSSQTFAVSYDFPMDETRQFQVFYSFQDTELALDALLTGTALDVDFPMQVMYLHVGGTSFWGDQVGQGGYIVGGLGATLFYPTSPGYDSELRFSANVGLGYEQPIGKRMSLRFEARGYFTLVNSSTAMFCSGGCTIAISGEGVAQGELSIGLAFGL